MFVVRFGCSFIVASAICGCSTVKGGSGAVAQQVTVCVDPEACKKEMSERCKKGGTIYKIAPAIAVQYSCNP